MTKHRGADRPFVTVKMEVYATVELPDEHKYNGQACKDPAIECAMAALGQGQVYLWGQSERPAMVYLDVSEEDCEIEDDNR